jgi:hypothetical protein
MHDVVLSQRDILTVGGGRSDESDVVKRRSWESRAQRAGNAQDNKPRLA